MEFGGRHFEQEEVHLEGVQRQNLTGAAASQEREKESVLSSQEETLVMHENGLKGLPKREQSVLCDPVG